MKNSISYYLVIFLFLSCHNHRLHQEGKKAGNEMYPEVKTALLNDTLIHLTDLQRGDLLVKPNHNWLPGSAWVKGGVSFGHVAIVVEGASGETTEEVLHKAVILESQARQVPREFQVRKVNACKPGFDYRFDNYSFDASKSPYRYRLRADLPASRKDSVIAFMERYENGISSWRAQKRYMRNYLPISADEESYWYCSHYIWQAFYTVLGIDIDVNQGMIVYPNDIIWCPLFDNDDVNKTKRVRF